MTELEKKLSGLEGLSEIKHYTLVNNYGCTFVKNGKHYDLRRWINCYGVDLGWQVFGTKANEDTIHLTPVDSLDLAIIQINTML